jgi:hypothetical protein
MNFFLKHKKDVVWDLDNLVLTSRKLLDPLFWGKGALTKPPSQK